VSGFRVQMASHTKRLSGRDIFGKKTAARKPPP